jgi:hypothetical protein
MLTAQLITIAYLIGSLWMLVEVRCAVVVEWMDF